MGRTSWVLVGAATVAATAYAAGPAHDAIAITIFASSDPSRTLADILAQQQSSDATDATGATGGTTYGATAPTGAIVTERHELDVEGDELRLSGVPASLDPASVQVRGATGPLAVTEQRFVPGADTVDELLQHHVGDPITVTTPKGDVTGTLRAVDDQAIVVESGGQLRVLRREGFVLDMKLGGTVPAGAQLVWRLAGAHPGKQAIEVTYRAEGLEWDADYSAVYDRGAKTVDFAAWATVKNGTSASFDGAALTLVAPSTGAKSPARFTVPGLVRLGAGETVQVELMPPRTAAKAQTIAVFEAMSDPSASPPTVTDCDSLNEQTSGTAQLALEMATPAALPAGKVRVFERDGARFDALADDALMTGSNTARIPLAPDAEILGSRATSSCTYDDDAHTLRETVTVTVENHGTQRASVVAREYLWRSQMWKIEPDAQSPKGVSVGPQAQEYRFDVAPHGKQVVAYTAVYQW